jgi:hypothetical protein
LVLVVALRRPVGADALVFCAHYVPTRNALRRATTRRPGRGWTRPVKGEAFEEATMFSA